MVSLLEFIILFSITDKSLNVVFNEKFVYDMNTNHNNANDDTHVTEASNSSFNVTPNRTNRLILDHKCIFLCAVNLITKY